MEINYLREFAVLAQTGNFMEAADQLYSSQSTLSKHIKNLEKELGVSLFDRTTRKVAITRYGQILLPYAQQIAELQDNYMRVLQSSLDTERDILTIGSIRALAQYKITDVLVNFKKNNPKTIVNIIQLASRDLKVMLRQKKCELAFVRDTNEIDDDLVKIPYTVDTMVAVLPITHPLANETLIPLQKLAGDDFVLLEKESYQYKLCMLACGQIGFEPRVAFTDERIENLMELVSKGMGVSLLMKPLALYAFNPNIAIVEITPSISTKIVLCYLGGTKLSDAARSFIQCAESQRPNLNESGEQSMIP